MTPPGKIVGYLVWIKGLKGVYPEKWPVDAPAGVKKDKEVLKQYPLNAELFEMKIAILEQRYQPPVL